MEALEKIISRVGWKDPQFVHGIAIFLIFFALPLSIYWSLNSWLVDLDKDKKPKTSKDKRTRIALQLGLVLWYAALLLKPWNWQLFSWLNFNGEFPWWKLIASLVLLGFGVIAFRRAWTGSFFIDKRDVVKGQKPAPPPARPYGFGVISAVGFFTCAMVGIWQPVFLLALPIFWSIGSIMVPEVTERWVPKFMNRPFLIPRGPIRKKFGDWYFYGSNHGNHRDSDINAPILPWYLGRVGIPVWMFLYSVTLLRYEAIERKYKTGFVPLGDNSTANIDLRVGVITCQHPSRFLRMSSEDQSTSVEVAGTVIVNDVISVMSSMSFDQVKGLDVTFDHSKQTELNGKLLEAVGHAFDTLDFGDPTRDPEIEKAQNAEAAAESESKRKIRLRKADGEAFTAEIDAALAALGLNPETATYEQRLRCLQEIGDLAEKKNSNIKVRGGGAVGTVNVD